MCIFLFCFNFYKCLNIEAQKVSRKLIEASLTKTLAQWHWVSLRGLRALSLLSWHFHCWIVNRHNEMNPNVSMFQPNIPTVEKKIIYQKVTSDTFLLNATMWHPKKSPQHWLHAPNNSSCSGDLILCLVQWQQQHSHLSNPPEVTCTAYSNHRGAHCNHLQSLIHLFHFENAG